MRRSLDDEQGGGPAGSAEPGGAGLAQVPARREERHGVTARRGLRPRVTWAAASPLVAGCCLAAARYVVGAWAGEFTPENAPLAWTLVGVVTLSLAAPWLLLLRRAARVGVRRRGVVVCSLAGYTAAGAASVIGLAAAGGPAALPAGIVLVVGLGLPMVALAVMADRRDSAAARRSGRRRRWMWAGAAVVAVGLSIVSYVASRAPAVPAPPTPRFMIGLWAAAEPSGPFSDLVSAPALGWVWAEGGERCREAVVLQPPFEVRGRTDTASQGTLRLLVAVSGCVPGPPARHPSLGAGDAGVLLRCAAYDSTGKAVAECRRDLRPPPLARDRFGPWEALELDLAGAADDTVDVVLEAKVDGFDPGAEPPVLAVSAVRPGGPGTLMRSSGPSERVLPAGGLPQEGPPVAPNCVIILVDALRPDRLHCYGYPADLSPRIDRLASQGALFEDVVSAASCTVPSVASLFTGTCVSTHGVVQVQSATRLPLPTLAEHFREAGALTAAVSANALVCPEDGFGAGFDDCYVGADWQEAKPRGKWVTDHAIDCLRRFNGRRFFLYVHYMEPHTPYDPPRGWDTFGRDDHARYLGEIRYGDSEIGRLLDELEALGRSHDTLVVFLADHGEAFNEHGYHEHGYTVHREEVQVPLILRWPGVIPAGTRVAARVASIDVHATIAELMGLPQPRHVEGASLLPLLGPGAPQADRTVYSELLVAPRENTAPPQMGLYEGDWKLILYLETGRRLLYDLRADPGERLDRAAAEPALAGAMERKIRAFVKQRTGVGRPRQPLTAAERALLGNVGYLTPSNRPTATRSASRPPDQRDTGG